LLKRSDRRPFVALQAWVLQAQDPLLNVKLALDSDADFEAWIGSCVGEGPRSCFFSFLAFSPLLGSSAMLAPPAPPSARDGAA
jgi:hypothetical protein